MTPEELRARTKAFAIAAIRLSRTLPADEATKIISKQFVRCATSVGANYRAACLAKSTADMIVKLKICEEEADEAQYWLQLLSESDPALADKTKKLESEALELFKILAASIRTLKAKNPKPK
jgi:four helix bundle protein